MTTMYHAFYAINSRKPTKIASVELSNFGENTVILPVRLVPEKAIGVTAQPNISCVCSRLALMSRKQSKSLWLTSFFRTTRTFSRQLNSKTRFQLKRNLAKLPSQGTFGGGKWTFLNCAHVIFRLAP